MRYVILGGGGSFGLHTAKYLLENDAERVVSIGRNPPKLPCFTLGVGDDDERYKYHALHLNTELEMVLDVIQDEFPDIIINFAAQGEGATSFNHSWRYFDTNCTALVRFIAGIEGLPLRRFVHISTSELYGSTEAPATEQSPIKPTSPYAVSKAAFDQYLLCLRDTPYKDVPFTILRPSNCYGEGQQLHRLIPRAVLYGLLGKKLPLHGGGIAEKSYLHSRDLARAIHLVAKAGAPGKVYNVGPDEPTSVKAVVQLVADALEMPFEELCEAAPDREHQDARYWLDSGAIKQDLQWRQRVDWQEGISRMVHWGAKHINQLRTLPVEFVMRA